MPNFSLGYRQQWEHNGLDLSFSALPLYYLNQVKLSALYLYYDRPNEWSQMYVGAGLGLSCFFGKDRWLFPHAALGLSPEFVIGKEYLNEVGDRRFIQMQVSVPTFNGHRTLCYPLIVFSYGLGF